MELDELITKLISLNKNDLPIKLCYLSNDDRWIFRKIKEIKDEKFYPTIEGSEKVLTKLNLISGIGNIREFNVGELIEIFKSFNNDSNFIVSINDNDVDDVYTEFDKNNNLYCVIQAT